MTRRALTSVLLVGLGVGLVTASGGCASADEKPQCPVDGTYSVTASRESGDCTDPAGLEPVTDTFTTLSDGRVKLEIQSLADLVPVGTVSGCKWTASLKFTLLDASGPETQGTLQYSYTFDQTGLSGIVSQYFPPSKDLPKGCRGTNKVTGTRR